MAAPRRKLQLTKTSEPDQPGAPKPTQKCGDALMCVRHRQDDQGLTRYTTVALIVDQTSIAARSGRMVGVKVAFEAFALRDQVRHAGARWDSQARVWRMPLRVAHALGLTERVEARG